jgi:hypothetical protein
MTAPMSIAPALVAMVLAPFLLAGQAPPGESPVPAGWDAPWVVGWSFGASPDMAREFGSTNPCQSGDRNAAGEARMTLRRGLGSHLGVEASASLARTVQGGATCLIVAPFPPNMTGVQRTTAVRHGNGDGRYLRTGVRLVGRASAQDGEFRVFTGAAVAPAFRAAGPTAGAAAAFGSGRLRLVLEGEGWLNAFPMVTVTREWEEGTVVSVQEERFRGDWNRSWTFRVGVEFHPG